jgi:hypothetical protein
MFLPQSERPSFAPIQHKMATLQQQQQQQTLIEKQNKRQWRQNLLYWLTK